MADPGTVRTDPLVGTRVAKGTLLVERRLGFGGMGSVYLALDEKTGDHVAVKVLETGGASQETIDRFKLEARLFGALRHPNLVRIFGYFREPGRLYIISEFIDGRNLWEILKANGPFTVEDALRIVRDAATGLHEAHRAHVVHRDLKPENIMLVERDGAVKVVDFGIAKDLAASVAFTKGKKYVGTVGYSAPEQVACRDLDHRADIFSLGVILYELLAGKVAFEGRETSEVFAATLQEDPLPVSELNRNVTAPVARLIDRMIQKSPRRRPNDMAEVVAAIERVREALAKGYTDEEKSGIGSWLQKLLQK